MHETTPQPHGVTTRRGHLTWLSLVGVVPGLGLKFSGGICAMRSKGGVSEHPAADKGSLLSDKFLLRTWGNLLLNKGGEVLNSVLVRVSDVYGLCEVAFHQLRGWHMSEYCP